VGASDIDGDNLSWSTANNGTNNDLLGSNGSLTLLIDGQWTYTLNNTTFAGLGKNESAVADSFTVYVSDGNGGVVAQDIEVTVTGNNKAPVISGNAGDGSDFIGTVVEDAADPAQSAATG
jgi:VCBS repeat-containing protein